MNVPDMLKRLYEANIGPAEIERQTDIHGPCVCRIMAGHQKDVHYRKGKRLERFYLSMFPEERSRFCDEAAHDERGPVDHEIEAGA